MVSPIVFCELMDHKCLWIKLTLKWQDKWFLKCKIWVLAAKRQTLRSTLKSLISLFWMTSTQMKLQKKHKSKVKIIKQLLTRRLCGWGELKINGSTWTSYLIKLLHSRRKKRDILRSNLNWEKSTRLERSTLTSIHQKLLCVITGIVCGILKS